ncbi:hypothetical protein JOC55_003454 [Paenibacillus sacheonensis]|nr:hypothetical protein [Paenibacillus sacheonensis]
MGTFIALTPPYRSLLQAIRADILTHYTATLEKIKPSPGTPDTAAHNDFREMHALALQEQNLKLYSICLQFSTSETVN